MVSNGGTPAYMATDWFAGLQREVKASTQKTVAARLGVARSTLTILLNGSGEYGNGRASTAKFEQRYRRAYEQIECPFTGDQVGAEFCREKALRQAPTHNPYQLNHWKTCQHCAFKPAALPPSRPRRIAVIDVPMVVLDTKTLPLPVVGAPQIDLTTEEPA